MKITTLLQKGDIALFLFLLSPVLVPTQASAISCADLFSYKDVSHKSKQELSDSENFLVVKEDYGQFTQDFMDAFNGIIFGGETSKEDGVRVSNFIVHTKDLLENFELPQEILREMKDAIQDKFPALYMQRKTDPRRKALNKFKDQDLIQIFRLYIKQKNHTYDTLFQKPILSYEAKSLLEERFIKAIKNEVISPEAVAEIMGEYQKELDRLNSAIPGVL